MMNERIFTELYKKAWGHFWCPTGEPELEKFAELIVRECISALDEADGSVHHRECLLEHFGVEVQTIEQDQIPLPKNREQAMAMLRVATFYLDTQK